MAIESLVTLGLVTVFLGILTWYVSHHRAEDEDHRHHSKGVTHN